MNYDYYRIFYYVAKYKNITQAAAALMSNQPNVTRVINNLERELECRLFVRSNRGVSLTPEGEELYRHAAIAFEQLQQGESSVLRQTALKGGVVYLGASETALHGLLLPVLSEFHRIYPEIHLKIMNYSTPQAMEKLAEGQIDFAVITTPLRLSSSQKEIRLKRFQDILAGGQQFAELTGRGLSLAELADYPLICMEKNTATFAFYQELFFAYGLELNPEIEAATTDLILPMIIHGLGIGFLPEEFAQEALERMEVVQIPLKEEIPERYISLVYDTKHELSIAAGALKKVLCETKECIS